MENIESRPADVGIDNHREAFSIWLDAFRWIAASAVLLAHVSHRMFLHFAEVPRSARSPMLYVVGGLSSFGVAAVIVFFVLSGYLVGGGSLRRYRLGRGFDWVEYLVSRLTRLWVVLIPVFFLTLILNLVGMHAFYPDPPMYDLSKTGLTWDVVDGPLTFACNVAFLQTALCNQYGGNAALWSLFNEFWYYIAWPPLMLALWSQRPMPTRIALAATSVVGLLLLTRLQMVGAHLAAYFLIWLLGVWAADRARPLLPVPPLVAAALLGAALVLWRVFSDSEVPGTNFLKPFLFDSILGLAFANLLMVLKATKTLRFPPLRRIHQPIAAFSFTLYCLHTPMISCIAAFLTWSSGTGWHMVPRGLTAFAIFFLTVGVCMIGAWLVSLATERQTPRLRRAVLAALGAGRRRAV